LTEDHNGKVSATTGVTGLYHACYPYIHGVVNTGNANGSTLSLTPALVRTYADGTSSAAAGVEG